MQTLLLRFGSVIVVGCALAACQNEDPGAVAPTTPDAITAIEKDAESPVNTDSEYTTTASGLQYKDLVEGTGESPERGANVTVRYTGTLLEEGKAIGEGTQFDSSRDRGTSFAFPIGVGRVIKGWDEGVGSMKPGGRRLLVIPPDLGYGAQGAGGVIPPNATLVFDVELILID